VPIVALTANAVSGTREMFLANGFDDFLSKPIDTVKLNAVLEKWIPKEKQKKVTGERIGKPSENDDGGIEIEGLDAKRGIAFLGGKSDLYPKILKVFHRDGIKKLDEIKKCMETENWALYVTYVHGLKSSAANIGATELSKMAAQLEAAGNREDIALIQAQNAALLSALETLIRNIGDFLEASKAEETTVDMAALKTAFAELEQAIDRVNPRAIKEAVKHIRPFTQAADIGDTVENILQHTLVGEYDEALALIKTLGEESP